jgi:putative addiction module component (TIGR02574 family)
MSDRDHIVEQALTLTPADRAYVADMLEQSLTNGGFATPEIAAAWAEEVERRIAAYDRGDVQAVGAEMAVDRMRRYLIEHHTRKARSAVNRPSQVPQSRG